MDIPEAKRDGKLISRLLAIAIGGFDKAVDKESQLYLRLLARLVDKAHSEYSIAREYIIEEIKTNDRLMWRIEIANHLENCVSAISRASKVVSQLSGGVRQNNRYKLKKDLDICKFISDQTKQKVASVSVSDLRNRVEHIDEDIYLNTFKGKVFLDVSDDYKRVIISDKSISMGDLVKMVTNYHELVLGVFNHLPKRWEKGKYYYD